MAFRRSNNFRRNGANFRSRSRFRPTGTDRKAKPTQRYEWGEFFTERLDDLPTAGGPGTTDLTYTRLATTRTIADPAEGSGVALISATRHIDVGGVVMDWSVDPQDISGVVDSHIDGRMYVMVALVVDRVDGAGIPTSLASWDPFQSSTPVASASNISGTPLGNTLDNDRPVRMLWQRSFTLDYLARTIVAPESGELYVPNNQLVATRSGTLNKKLRLRLSDELGLYFVQAFRASATFGLAIVPQAASWFRGSIYYRYAF